MVGWGRDSLRRLVSWNGGRVSLSVWVMGLLLLMLLLLLLVMVGASLWNDLTSVGESCGC